jgi:S-adenosylmethionine-diacylglycerol 3-amino-3-carboxypropyl transferase
MTRSEIQHRADFSRIRYAQCWEDSALLKEALLPAGRDCVSIGSAGDNSFALLAHGAASVTAVEMNPAQIACIELRKAAYLNLEHPELLALIGSRPATATHRLKLYGHLRGLLPEASRSFWDNSADAIAGGIGSAGKFERYFAMFRKVVLPMAHGHKRVLDLLGERTPEERALFYQNHWNNRRWRWIFQLFFSRQLMGLLGRDPEFFRYVEGSVAQRILERTRHALVELDPSANPYLHWILTGTHGETLPEALEERHFNRIHEALREDRLRIVHAPLESLLGESATPRFDAFNLSDIFEYMSETNTAVLLGQIAAAARPGARLAYWNMLAARERPESLAQRLRSHPHEAVALLAADRAFFYSRFVIEEVLP